MSATKLTIRKGDCIAEMASLAPGSVDVIVTSPPYNLGIDYGKFDDRKSKTDYLDWTERWAKEAAGRQSTLRGSRGALRSRRVGPRRTEAA